MAASASDLVSMDRAMVADRMTTRNFWPAIMRFSGQQEDEISQDYIAMPPTSLAMRFDQRRSVVV